MTTMNWYLGKLVFRIICGEGNHTPQFDEQLRLIAAVNEEEAFDKALQIGRQEQEEFLNQEEQLVQWQFINVSELYKLSGLLDGAELYSRIQETDDPDRYMGQVHQKAAHILEGSTHKFLALL